MRTVIFIVPAMNGGGAERVLSVLAGYLNKQGYHVKFVLTKGRCVEYELDAGISVEYNPYGGAALHQMRFIREQLKHNREAVFVSFFTHQSLYALLLNLQFRRRVVVSERSDPSQTFDGIQRLLFPVRNFLYSKAEAVVFQTPGARDYYPISVRKKGTIIPNPLKQGLPNRYCGVRRKEIVTFARLDQEKNYPMLIHAFEKFSKVHPEYTLAIYGKGPEEENLKKLVSQKNLESKVHFFGFCNSLHTEILDAAMFALTSDYEGVSNSMLEAMAIGLPCICTDCAPGGARMFIRNEENGLIVPVQDVEAMQKAMVELAENPKLAQKISRNAEKIRDDLQIETIGPKWEKIIETCR